MPPKRKRKSRARQPVGTTTTSTDTAVSLVNVKTPPSQTIARIDCPSPLSYSSDAASLSSANNHLLELELIHTWSVETWTGMEVLPGCEQMLKVNFVRESLEHRFLMDAIFALAATQRAYTHRRAGDAAGYARYDLASINYGNRATEGFRRKLHTATQNDLHLLYYFASITAVLNLLVARQYACVLDCFDVSLKLFLGSFSITELNLDWIQKSTHSVALRAGTIDSPPEMFEALDPTTRKALDCLQRVCDTVRVPRGVLPRDPVASSIGAYRRAIAQAKASFAQRRAGQVAGFFFTITAMGGRELAAAVAAREPISLFIHLYGLVLMHAAGEMGGLWWVGSLGSEMVDEITALLARLDMGQLEDVQWVMRWVREQVGLPPMEMPRPLPELVGEVFDISSRAAPTMVS